MLATLGVASGQDFPTDPAAKFLPDRVGEFRASGSVQARKDALFDERDHRAIQSWARREYLAKDNREFSVVLYTTFSDSGAYSAFASSRMSVERSSEGENVTTTANVGTAGFSYWDGNGNSLTFFKGKIFVATGDDGKTRDLNPLLNFSNTIAETLDKGEGAIPVLIQHLPDWQNAQYRALYAVNHDYLKEHFINQRVLDEVSFAGGTEAVMADYDGAWLVIVEFNTPQIASDHDRRITAKIQELGSQGQAVPTAYRRVGNYSVFVFNAPTQEAANQLIDQVKYQQVVQWLGKNPYAYEQATREFTQTTLGVFVAVVKASGLAILGSLAIGGLVGALLFSWRRKQQRAEEAFSDAGGMLRLNIDELTAQRDSARLLGPGN